MIGLEETSGQHVPKEVHVEGGTYSTNASTLKSKNWDDILSEE